MDYDFLRIEKDWQEAWKKGLKYKVEEVEVARRDHPFLDQRFEIDDAGPELLAIEKHRSRLDLAGLDQGQQFE